LRKRTRNDALARISTMPADELFTSGQSYFGLFRQASHSHADRARLANALRARGLSVGHRLTHTYRSIAK
jgi:hypothetical protein